MSREHRFNRLLLIGALLLCISVLYLAARRRSSKEDTASPVSRRTVKNPADSLKYWTADKMRKARGVNMPQVKDLGPQKKDSKDTPHTSDPDNA